MSLGNKKKKKLIGEECLPDGIIRFWAGIPGPAPAWFCFQEYPDLADAAFTSPYSLEKKVKEWMEHYGSFQPWNYPTDHLKYKYLISIDGNTFASNLWWQLLSNCAVLEK